MRSGYGLRHRDEVIMLCEENLNQVLWIGERPCHSFPSIGTLRRLSWDFGRRRITLIIEATAGVEMEQGS